MFLSCSPCSARCPSASTPNNFINIVTQAAHIAIIAIGMTFVLLVAGIDLSVGANMYASCIVVALYLKGWNPIFGFLVAGSLGLPSARSTPSSSPACACRFIATLATLFIGRAIALYFSGVKMIPFGKELTRLGRSTCWASRPRSGSSCWSSCWPGSPCG